MVGSCASAPDPFTRLIASLTGTHNPAGHLGASAISEDSVWWDDVEYLQVDISRGNPRESHKMNLQVGILRLSACPFHSANCITHRE